MSIVAVFDGDSETGMHHLVKDPDKQLRQAVDGFRQVMKRGGLVGLTVLTGRAARLMSRPPSFATRR